MRRLVLLCLAACGREPAHETPVMVPERPEHAPLTLELATDVGEGLASPEAIIRDPVDDVYLVSNLDGAPHAADDNGYISRISPDGTVIERRWIDGMRPEVTLHAPRGMAIAGNTLYVVDLDAVRLFDRKTGAPIASWPVPDPHFPNDIRVDADGSAIVTETAIHLLPTGPVPEGTSTIWRFSRDGTPTAIARGAELAGPNGIALTDDGIVSVAFLGDAIYRVVDGTPQPIAHLPATQLDGLVQLPDGSLLVTSWKPRAIWRVWADGSYRREFGEASFAGAASIEYDPTRGRVLIPLVLANLLRFEPYALPRP